MSEKHAPYLHVVRTPPPASQQDEETSEMSHSEHAEETTSAVDAANEQEGASLNTPLQQAIMHAAVSWVALVMERNAHSVDIQPIAQRVYEVSVHCADESGADAGEGVILRVQLAMDPGLVIRTTVEPVKP